MSRKIEPNIPKNMNREETLPSEKARFLKNRIGSIGLGARSSQATNAAVKATPSPSAVRISRARPAQVVPPHEPPHEPEHAGADEADARQVELAAGPVGLGQAA